MKNKDAIKILKTQRKALIDHVLDMSYPYESHSILVALDLAIKALENQPQWIPVKTEKVSDDEKKELAEKYGMSPEEFDDCWRYACKMPEDNQDCLITTSVWGYVCIDTFHIDEDGAMYFEDHEDEDDVLAWMPLPKPYTKEETT